MLKDLCVPNLRIIFCGTAAGHRSAALKLYYAGRGNRFWQILAATKLTPRLLSPSEYTSLPEFGIGLTDIAKGRRGNDVEIQFRIRDRDPLRRKVLEYQPDFLCFNGKRAAQEFFGKKDILYGLQSERIGSTRLFVAPSTSGAARASWDAAIWRDLARRVRAARRSSGAPR
ncbi:MAG TPA: mismatch-specific DNA-glycosylase [Gemmatimonadales bacterium]|nr:mismatch-specific DNA-glycosylase [Gemmatimonadales bacterium]